MVPALFKYPQPLVDTQKFTRFQTQARAWIVTTKEIANNKEINN